MGNDDFRMLELRTPQPINYNWKKLKYVGMPKFIQIAQIASLPSRIYKKK